ncbi:hypothetical protein HanPI659440_Chr02g0081141 [Helianthus annuus]|nr:hypothetical protein HanPI659440_Chr02g0081141 [Helianthus annuus]
MIPTSKVSKATHLNLYLSGTRTTKQVPSINQCTITILKLKQVHFTSKLQFYQ